MSDSEARRAAILKRCPELGGLGYSVRETELAVARRRLPGAGPDSNRERKYTYTFRAAVESSDVVEIKVTVNEAGDILKLVTSKSLRT